MKEERISTYWMNFFGIGKGELRKSRVIVVPHRHLEDYQGAWIFKRDNWIIISVQPKTVDQITNKTKRVEPKEVNVFSRPYLEYLFGKEIERIVGPVYQGYYDDTETVLQVSKEVREINFKEDQELITRLSKSGDEEGWLNSSINKNNKGMYGYFHKDKIESIGCYNIVRGDVAFIGVYTNPNFRGIGFSQEVLKKMVMDLSARGKLIRYQTLLSNEPSIRLAGKIGFEEYANNIAIRLKKNED